MSTKEKNRFSLLLDKLIHTAQVKHSILANDLTYDASYISKWISGKLPSAKTEKQVMEGIAHCIITNGSEEGLAILLQDYLVTSIEDLEIAIYDNLMAECTYARNVQQDNENNLNAKTLYFPKLDMRQYIQKMHHPVLRRVKSLEIMAIMDLMAMDREYRMEIARIEDAATSQKLNYPGVHFSMVINLDSIQRDYVYDTVFLLNMLTDMTCVDFRLYGSRNAYGRAVFAVKDEFSIAAMLTHNQKCLSVVVSEEENTANIHYHTIMSLCNRERLLLRQMKMEEMLRGSEYARSLIAPNQRMLFGHMTEHFLSASLLEEIIESFHGQNRTNITADQLQWVHALSARRFQEQPVQIMFYESALSEFAVNGELDFYNMKIHLTPAQRLEYLRHLQQLMEEYTNIEVRLIYGSLFSDFQYHANQCILLSDGTSFLRLVGQGNLNGLYSINHVKMHAVFDCFYDEVWENAQGVVISDRETVLSYIEHIVQQAEMIARLESRSSQNMEST